MANFLTRKLDLFQRNGFLYLLIIVGMVMILMLLIKLQQDGKRYSTVKTVRGVLRPAFQMAVDDDVLHKNPFGFELAGVVVNDSVTREALTREQMRKFLKFVHDDNVYCK